LFEYRINIGTFGGCQERQGSRYPSISLSTPIFVPAGPLPRPEVVCPGGLRLSPGSSLSSGIGLGALSSIAVKYLASEGQVVKIFEKLPLSGWWVDNSMEIYAIIAVIRQSGYKRGCFSRLNSGKWLHKTVF
jgi:hypothetical protein